MDFTPLLPQLRQNHALAGELIGQARVVMCLGSRALISLLVGASPQSEQILGVATTAGEGLALVAGLQPDLLLVTDRLEEGCGVDLVVAVKRHHPSTRTLLLVCQEQRHSRIRRAIDACCDGVLLESRLGLGIELTALRSVRDGGIFIDGQLAASQALPSLSDRETEVLQQAAQGQSNAEIADHLFLSIDTVKSHVRNVLMKLHARDRAQAVAIGVRLGLID